MDGLPTLTDPARDAVAALHGVSEADALLALLPAAQSPPAERERILARAGSLVEALRAQARRGGGIEHFLQEYQLSTPEGVTMLCLAEAFLRIPDPITADALIRDKLGAGDWAAHVGQSPSTLVNASSRMLAFTRRLLEEDRSENRWGGLLHSLALRGGEPLVRGAVGTAMRVMGDQFVTGRSIEEALKRAGTDARAGFRHSFDMLGEGARTAADAVRYMDSYRAAIAAIGRAGTGTDVSARNSISIKLSALHPRYEVSQAGRCMPALTDALLELATRARDANIGLTVDAEEADRLELSLDIIARVASASALSGWNGLGLAVQAYGTRARAVVGWAAALGERHRRRLMVRLVKGAYWDTEIKRAQERGLDRYPVFTRKAATDVSYLACAQAMLDAPFIYPAFATHNALTAATIMERAGPRRDWEFQRLHGMGEGLYERLIADDGVQCRIYAPVGAHRDLLAYLVRRLLENGANSSFVNQVADADASMDTLLADPAALVRAAGLTPHPRIPLPAALYGAERVNSRGLDLADVPTLNTLQSGLDAARRQNHAASALVSGREMGGAERPVSNPANTAEIVGTVREATAADVDAALAAASQSAGTWSRRPVAERAACLDRAADLLETGRVAFMGLAIAEAGKTIPDAVAEIREAVDFLRYYAARARGDFELDSLPGPTGEQNSIALAGRGVFACISPWNFPLAIFMGQVSAALVAGNSVVAKPAPQTPLIAHRAVRLLHEAGVPPDVLHLLPGGAAIGQALVADPRIAGVAFTGSTAAARAINRTLAAGEGAIVPLIAETGGLNAMIADSSALPEQVVADVLNSGFGSAGQRCSALRVLYLQEDNAPRVLEMLAGAMDELVVGDPAHLTTDIGPVIDRDARDRILAHVEAHKSRVVHAARLGAGADRGWFVPPQLIALDHGRDLQHEVFGPIVHVVRWAAGHLDALVDGINASGYGLTLGVHSRIGRTVEAVRSRARVGNLYVNRSMIGAVVGVQPFGGEGLSGTGPKAGGPWYLHRFATERTVSVDTTSAGGNATLMSLAET